VTERFRSMGCEIVVGGATADETGEVRDLFAERDRAFSRFRSDSELSRVNAFPSRILVVSDAFAGMLRLALRASEATGGVVDPTVGAALVALGYDRDFAELDADGDPIRLVPGGRSGEIRVRGRILERPVGVELDLNGVVKSRTVDDALALLAGPGFVSAGGDLAARGPLDVALPGGDAIRLDAGALATSGTLTRSWLRGGERLHHLVEPATGRPAASPWACVTVGARTCVEADVAAKAAFLLGDTGAAWLDDRELPGRLVGTDGRVVLTASWEHQAPSHARAA
jgi:thiamine biosynthesis lipoprotein